MAMLEKVNAKSGFFDILGLSTNLMSDNFMKLSMIFLPYFIILVVSQNLSDSALGAALKLLALATAFLTHIASVYFISKKIQGEDSCPGSSWSFVQKHWIKILLTNVLFFLIVVGLTIVSFMPISLAPLIAKSFGSGLVSLVVYGLGIALLAIGLWQLSLAFIRLIFFGQTIAIEEKFLKESLDASTDLVKGNFSSAMLYCFYYSILATVLVLVPMIVLTLSFIGTINFTALTDPKQIGIVGSSVYNLVAIFSGIFLVCFQTLYYYKFKSMG